MFWRLPASGLECSFKALSQEEMCTAWAWGSRSAVWHLCLGEVRKQKPCWRVREGKGGQAGILPDRLTQSLREAEKLPARSLDIGLTESSEGQGVFLPILSSSFLPSASLPRNIYQTPIACQAQIQISRIQQGTKRTHCFPGGAGILQGEEQVTDKCVKKADTSRARLPEFESLPCHSQLCDCG